MFLGLEKVDPENVSSHKDCRLGKWYYDPKTQERFKGLPKFQQLEEHHQQVHNLARETAKLFNNHQMIEAEASLKQLNQASDLVVSLIDEMLQQYEK